MVTTYHSDTSQLILNVSIILLLKRCKRAGSVLLNYKKCRCATSQFLTKTLFPCILGQNTLNPDLLK